MIRALASVVVLVVSVTVVSAADPVPVEEKSPIGEQAPAFTNPRTPRVSHRPRRPDRQGTGARPAHLRLLGLRQRGWRTSRKFTKCLQIPGPDELVRFQGTGRQGPPRTPPRKS